VKVLLDENFPLPLHAALSALGYDVEHIILLGQRGMADSAIRERLVNETVVFLTNDTEFLDQTPPGASRVIVSRVPQRLRVGDRVAIWVRAIRSFLESPPPGAIFELLETGEIVAWRVSADTL